MNDQSDFSSTGGDVGAEVVLVVAAVPEVVDAEVVGSEDVVC
jgi:hypothetical protein